jgi:hypothetical protein
MRGVGVKWIPFRYEPLLVAGLRRPAGGVKVERPQRALGRVRTNDLGAGEDRRTLTAGAAVYV